MILLNLNIEKIIYYIIVNYQLSIKINVAIKRKNNGNS